MIYAGLGVWGMSLSAGLSATTLGVFEVEESRIMKGSSN